MYLYQYSKCIKMNIIKIAFFLSILFITGCKSYSTHSIDEKSKIKIDARLLGTWKAIEDTDTKNCIVVQSYNDLFPNWAPSDVDSVNKDCYYFVTYLNRHGRNPLYQQFSAFLSKVQNASFLNLHYWDDSVENGFLLIRIIKMNNAADSITTALVADSTLKNIQNSASLRQRISSHLNSSAFYSDTLHFYKVNNVHRSLEEARDNANR